MTDRTSLTPAVTADSSTKRRSAAVATRWASVVLPVPGGPQMIAESGPAAPPDPSMSRRSGLPGPQHLGLAAHLVEGARPHPHGERGDPGRGRLLPAVGGGGRTEEVLRAVHITVEGYPRAEPLARGPGRRVRPRDRWPGSADSSRATRGRWVAAWVVIAIACFAVAVGGVTGESLFERLHSGAPTVESESSRAQEVIAAEPARPRDPDDAGDRRRPHRRARSWPTDGRDARGRPGPRRQAACARRCSSPRRSHRPVRGAAAQGRHPGRGRLRHGRRLRAGSRQGGPGRGRGRRPRRPLLEVPTAMDAQGSVGSPSKVITAITTHRRARPAPRRGHRPAADRSSSCSSSSAASSPRACRSSAPSSSIGGALLSLFGFSHARRARRDRRQHRDPARPRAVHRLRPAHREPLPRGARRAASTGSPRREEVAHAAERTVATAGRTVLFSGLTSRSPSSGLLLFEASIMRAIGVAGVSVVLVAMVVAITLVPALCVLGAKRLARKAVDADVRRRVLLPAGRRGAAPPVAVIIAVVAVLVDAGPADPLDAAHVLGHRSNT